MNSEPFPNDADLPVFDDETDSTYTVEVIAELAGVDSKTVLHYQEQGFIRPVTIESESTTLFDVECLRQLRRIKHLRATCGMNDTGLKLILDLLHEVEILRQERRKARR